MRLWYIAAQEVGAQIAGVRFRVATVASVLLTILAVAAGVQDYARRQDQFVQRTQDVLAERRLAKPLMGWALEPSLRVLRPPAVTSVFVRGLDAGLPAYWDFSPQGVIEGPLPPSLTKNSEVSGWLDLELIVRAVLGLLAVILGLETVATSRATGTLTALLIQPIHRQTILFGKLAGATATLTLALVAMSGAAVAALRWMRPDLVTSDVLLSLATFTAAALGYLLILFIAAVMVGSAIRGDTAAAAAAAALWVATALVAPQVTAVAVRALVPVPEPAAVAQDRQQRSDARLHTAMDFYGQRYRQLAVRTPLTFHAEIDLDEAGRSAIRRAWNADARDTRSILDALDARARHASDTQSQWLRWSSRLTPGTLFVEIATNLSDTGRMTQDRWATAVASYQEQLAARLFDDLPRLTLKVPAGAGPAIANLDSHAPLHTPQLPAFLIPEASVAVRLRSGEGDLVTLLCYLVALTGAALLAFPRTGLVSPR